eukprot:971947-Pelagomonas_calceolata.AAC.1
MKSKWQPLVLKEETHKDLLFSIASTRVLLFLHIALCVQEEIQGLQGKVRKLEEAMNMLGAEAETMKDEIQSAAARGKRCTLEAATYSS